MNEKNVPIKENYARGFLIYSFVMMIILSIDALLALAPNDFFPYLRIGEEIIKTGNIPSTEFMTYTQFGRPAVYLYWLPSLLFLEAYKLGGVTLIALISIICIGGYYTFLWLSLLELKIRSTTAGFILILVALVGALFFPTRPQLLVYPLFSLSILIILRWQRGNNRFLFLLPIIMIIWVNMHASYVVLLVFLTPTLIFGSGNKKWLMLVACITLFSTLLNYYGFGLWKNVFSMLNNNSIKQFSIEWGPPVNQGWQANIFFFTLLFIPVLSSLSKTRIKPIYWILFLGFGWMSLSSVRYIIWFLPFEAVILSILINPMFEKYLGIPNRFQNRNFNRVIGVFLLTLPLIFLPGIRSLWWEQSPPVLSDTTPIKAVEWLRQFPQLPDNLWSDFSYSTYLAYALPERKLFLSNRIEDLSVDQLEDNERISSAKYNWQHIVDKYNINLIMAGIQLQPDLITALSASPDWKEIYRDQQTVLFLKNLY